ncbi:hypothetical protein TYRP_015349 [Tyrophagus putrescentiae]|nr:hypothetical protein TYRP_015349 [Tyrophagus putrescentiae]
MSYTSAFAMEKPGDTVYVGGEPGCGPQLYIKPGGKKKGDMIMVNNCHHKKGHHHGYHKGHHSHSHYHHHPHHHQGHHSSHPVYIPYPMYYPAHQPHTYSHSSSVGHAYLGGGGDHHDYGHHGYGGHHMGFGSGHY